MNDFQQQDIQNNRTMVILMWIFPILFFLYFVQNNNSPYMKRYANNTLLIFIVNAASGLISFIPIIGWLIGIAFTIFMTVIWIMNLLNGINGKNCGLPIVGDSIVLIQ